MQELLNRINNPNVDTTGSASSGSMSSIFRCTQTIDTMLLDLEKEVSLCKQSFPLPQDTVSKVHSAMIYVGLDSGSFHHMMINAKKGRYSDYGERRASLSSKDYEGYGYIVLDQTKSMQIYTNMLVGFVFGRLGLDPKEYFKSVGFYLGHGLKEFEDIARISSITKKLEFDPLIQILP